MDRSLLQHPQHVTFALTLDCLSTLSRNFNKEKVREKENKLLRTILIYIWLGIRYTLKKIKPWEDKILLKKFASLVSFSNISRKGYCLYEHFVEQACKIFALNYPLLRVIVHMCWVAFNSWCLFLSPGVMCTPTFCEFCLLSQMSYISDHYKHLTCPPNGGSLDRIMFNLHFFRKYTLTFSITKAANTELAHRGHSMGYAVF